jgi:hypothetical protein
MDFTPDRQALFTHQHSQAEIPQQVDVSINSQDGTILEPVIEDVAAVSLSEADLGQVIAENEELLGELAEGSAAAGVTGAFSVAFYVALKDNFVHGRSPSPWRSWMDGCRAKDCQGSLKGIAGRYGSQFDSRHPNPAFRFMDFNPSYALCCLLRY